MVHPLPVLHAVDSTTRPNSSTYAGYEIRKVTTAIAAQTRDTITTRSDGSGRMGYNSHDRDPPTSALRQRTPCSSTTKQKTSHCCSTAPSLAPFATKSPSQGGKAAFVLLSTTTLTRTACRHDHAPSTIGRGFAQTGQHLLIARDGSTSSGRQKPGLKMLCTQPGKERNIELFP